MDWKRTGKKLLHVLGMVLLVFVIVIALLAMLGTVVHASGLVDAETMQDATVFLETFFKLYSTATEKELAYYVAESVLEPINGDYLHSELINPIFTQDGENVKVSMSVKFLDNQTKATQISQFKLTLHKDSNWKIVD